MNCVLPDSFKKKHTGVKSLCVTSSCDTWRGTNTQVIHMHVKDLWIGESEDLVRTGSQSDKHTPYPTLTDCNTYTGSALHTRITQASL